MAFPFTAAMKSLLLLFIFTCGFFVSAHCQEHEEQFEHLTLSEGFSSNDITSLLQDHFGFLWIGTSNGLNRYDGQDVQRYFHSYHDTNSVAGDDILHLCEINQKYIFIATTHGLSIFNLQTNSFQNSLIHLSGLTSFDGHYVSNVFQDHNKQIYISFDNLFEVFDSSFHLLYSITDLPNSSWLKAIMLRNIQEDAEGRLWILTYSGIALFDPVKKEVLYREHNPMHWKIFDFDCAFYGFTLDEQKQSGYFSCWNQSLFKFNTAANEIEIHKAKSTSGNDLLQSFTSILSNKNGTVWCGCDEGLCSVNPSDNSFKLFTYDDSNPFSISSNNVSALLLDKDDNLWVGTENGLNRLSLKNSPFHFYSLDINKDSAIKTEISGIVKNNQDLWISTWNDALWTRSEDGNWSKQKIDPSNASSKTIWDICKASDGNLWVATEGGLYVSNDSTHHTFGSPKNYPDSLKHQKTIMVFEDSHHDIWASLHGAVGLLHFETRTGLWSIYRNNFSSPYTLPARQFINITEDKQGDIWLGNHYYGDAGIACWNRGMDRFKLNGVKNEVAVNPLGERNNCLLADKNNVLWIGSNDYGLIRFNTVTGVYKVYLRDDGLPDNEVDAIIKDRNGYIWLATSNGIGRFDPRTEKCSNFGSSYGLPGQKFNSKCFYDSLQNEIYLTTLTNIVYFNPDQVNEDKSSSPALITNIKSGGKNLPLTSAMASINYFKNAINFAFTAINFRDGRNTQYAYRLDGFDNDWNYCGNNRSASYENLSPGNYTFRVKAANGAGVWNEQAAVFRFMVNTPFYYEWWFMAGCILVMASVLYIIYRVRVARILAIEGLRSRISRDLHDDVGSTLSSITMLSKLARTKMNGEKKTLDALITRIEEGSQRMTQNMQDIVWAVNPGNDSMQIIIARMRSFAIQALDCKNIQLYFEADKSLAEDKLGLEERQDLYLIFKESINNAVKYSEAKVVKVVIIKNGKHYEMKIQDDGKGFNTLQAQTGNGLVNIRKRAERMNAALKIKSVQGTGTTIELIF